MNCYACKHPLIRANGSSDCPACGKNQPRYEPVRDENGWGLLWSSINAWEESLGDHERKWKGLIVERAVRSLIAKAEENLELFLKNKYVAKNWAYNERLRSALIEERFEDVMVIARGIGDELTLHCPEPGCDLVPILKSSTEGLVKHTFSCPAHPQHVVWSMTSLGALFVWNEHVRETIARRV